MKTETLLLGGAVAAAAFYFLRRPANAAAAGAPTKYMAVSAPFMATAAVGMPGFSRAGGSLSPKDAAAAANLANPGGSAVKPSSSSIGARDIAGLAGAAAAAAGCNAVPGVGTALSPLCGIGGNYLGGKAYDYGKQAVDWVGGLF